MYRWNNMSYNRYANRKNERELDFFELEELKNAPCDCDDIGTIRYGIIEDFTWENTFSVEDLFSLCESEEY